MKHVIYDIETLSNCFTACFYNVDDGKKKEFSIRSGENSDSLYYFLISLKNNGYTLVGFNNLRFDAQVLEYIIQGCNKTCEEIYKEAQRLILEIGRAHV